MDAATAFLRAAWSALPREERPGFTTWLKSEVGAIPESRWGLEPDGGWVRRYERDENGELREFRVHRVVSLEGLTSARS